MTPKHDTAHSGQKFLCHPRVPLTHLGHPKALPVHHHPQRGGWLWWEAQCPMDLWGDAGMGPGWIPEHSQCPVR